MGTVTKALSLLNLFNLSRAEIGLSDMARLAGLNKATTYRLLSELQDQGIVEQVGGDRSYRLGAGVLRLAALREATVPLMEISRGILRDLSTQTGETAHMSVLRGKRLNLLTHTYSPAHATKVTMEDVEDLAFHATASGLAILAFCDPGFVDEALSGDLPAFAARTETSPGAIRGYLEAVRETGIAEVDGWYEDDVHSHAAPVFGADRRPIGALAVAAPASRMTGETIAAIHQNLIQAAQSMTAQIGGFFPENHPLEQAA